MLPRTAIYVMTIYDTHQGATTTITTWLIACPSGQKVLLK